MIYGRNSLVKRDTCVKHVELVQGYPLHMTLSICSNYYQDYIYLSFLPAVLPVIIMSLNGNCIVY